MYSCKVVNYNGSMSMIDSRTNKPKRSDYLICNLKQKNKKIESCFLAFGCSVELGFFYRIGRNFSVAVGSHWWK